MIDNKKVIAWIPYGRRSTVEILLEYLQRDHDRGIVDELWLYMNTDPGQVDDMSWAILTARKRSWVKLVQRPIKVVVHQRKQRNTGYAYRYMTDPDTVYVRFDDDVVYVHEDTIATLALHKIYNPAVTCSFPIIINNAICSHFLQKDGKIPIEWGEVDLFCMDKNGWGNGQFAIKLHEQFLADIENDDVEGYFGHHDWQLPLGEQFSVSCFASLGSMYAKLDPPGVIQPDQTLEEESWHTETQPRRVMVPNVIVSNAIVSHYTFFTQHPFFAGTDILDRYRTLAKGLNR